MNILISGSTGFVGSYLKNKFISDGYNVFDLNRSDFLINQEDFFEKLNGMDVIINLSGAPIIAKWTDKYKKVIYNSRIDTTKKIVSSISKLENKPKLYINASAVGIYKQGFKHSENSLEFDEGFLGNIVSDWEKESLKNIDNCRTVVTRFGVILGKGGFLSKIINVFKLGLGGKIGNGKFTMNFVDIEDIYRFFKFSIENNKIEGIYNLSNINITNYNFTKVFGKVLIKPTIFPLPKFILKILYGEGSKVVFSDMEVFPDRTLESGFDFKNKSLEDILKKYI